MRADEIWSSAEPRVGAKLGDPDVGHVFGLGLRSGEEGAADEQHVGTVRIEADAGAELLAPARGPVEPLVEGLRAGDDDSLVGHPVQAHRLVTLKAVPDDDAVGHVAELLLAREVVPARDAHAGRNPVSARRLDVLRVATARHQVRDEHEHVWSELAQLDLEVAVARKRALERIEK